MFNIAAIYTSVMSYHIFSFVVGIVLLIEAFKSIYNMCKIRMHDYHKIEHIVINILVSNIVILILLSIRSFLEAFILNRNGVSIFGLAILRVVPPLIYVYMQRILQGLIIGNSNIGIDKKNGHERKKGQ